MGVHICLWLARVMQFAAAVAVFVAAVSMRIAPVPIIQ